MAFDDEWFDLDPGRIVRLYAQTGGRTRPTNRRLDLATQVIAAHAVPNRTDLEPEHLRILELCRGPLSVAEVAAYLNVPLVVAKVQLSDLIDRQAVVMGSPPRENYALDRGVLQAVLDGLQAL